MKRCWLILLITLCSVCLAPIAGKAAPPTLALAHDMATLWDRIDGSTATIPLTTALSNLFNRTGKPPVHNTTATAYKYLLSGKADLIFVTYPSPAELEMVRQSGTSLDIIPIVKDALVFLVNADNPVSGLTTAQLQGIYEGKITNWNMLSGLDEAIVPYQRTQNSGSQTLLQKLVMGEKQPMEPAIEWAATDMGGLVEYLSSYDNSRQALGYSMFYYVNNMYGNSRFKLLAVDGIKPNRDTIAEGTYPLGTNYFAVVRSEISQDSPYRQLIKWVLTLEGQTLATKAGYIPLAPIQGVYTDEPIDPIYLGEVNESSGTGGTTLKPNGAYLELTQNGVRAPLSDVFYDGFNYIAYINDTILDHLRAPTSSLAYQYNLNGTEPPLNELAKRAFPGIPNDYPHYGFYEFDPHLLIIELSIDNPYFSDLSRFFIPLTTEISPYGPTPPKYTTQSVYDRRLTPEVDLYTLSVQIKDAPEVSARINEQLKAWTDSFPGGADETVLLDRFIEYNLSILSDPESIERYVYDLQPVFGMWEQYISVSYTLHSPDESPRGMPLLYSITFDTQTGEQVDLVQLVPDDWANEILYAMSTTTQFGQNVHWWDAEIYNYVPPEGATITRAYSWYGSLILLVAEPSGRVVEVGVDWFV